MIGKGSDGPTCSCERQRGQKNGLCEAGISLAEMMVPQSGQRIGFVEIRLHSPALSILEGAGRNC
jgi:hypothetical protein